METDQTITEIVADVASALKDAAAEYGPQAADLALMAYRVDAISSLLFIPASAAIVYGSWRAWGYLKAVSAGWVTTYGSMYDDTSGRDIARILGATLLGAVSFIVSCVAVTRAMDIPLWMAALGNPELLIATRALQAAGLM